MYARAASDRLPQYPKHTTWERQRRCSSNSGLVFRDPPTRPIQSRDAQVPAGPSWPRIRDCSCVVCFVLLALRCRPFRHAAGIVYFACAAWLVRCRSWSLPLRVPLRPSLHVRSVTPPLPLRWFGVRSRAVTVWFAWGGVQRASPWLLYPSHSTYSFD